MNSLDADLDTAYAELDVRGRYAIVAYAERFPRCLAAAVGLAMTRGVRARDIEAVIEEMAPNTRGLLFLDARRQQRVAENQGVTRRAAVYGAIADLAHREQIAA